MAIDFPLTPSQPFSLTLPTTATVNSAGEVVCDLSANATEAMAAAEAAQDTADDAVVDAATAQATADAAVPKSYPVALHSSRLSLIISDDGTMNRIRPGFDGTFTEAQFIIDGATTAVGACSIAITLDGAAVVLDDALSAPIASVAGFAVSTFVNPPVAFTRYQDLAFTVTSANTSATFGTVTLSATLV